MRDSARPSVPKTRRYTIPDRERAGHHSLPPAQFDRAAEHFDQRRDEICEKYREDEEEDHPLQRMECPEGSRHRQHDEDDSQHGACLRPRSFRRCCGGRLCYRFRILPRMIRFSHGCPILTSSL